MNLRRTSGATMAIIAGSIIFIVIVALAFYFLSQLLGGGRELQHATNSGTLNVAKQALVNPKNLPLPAGSDETRDMKEIILGVAQNAEDKVDLLHFNRMVGAAMLVAMNAEADGAGTSVSNAQKFIDLVEGKNGGGGGQPSIGQTLKNALSDGPSWAKNFFNDTAMGNSIRMLTDKNQISWQAQDFKVGYLAAGAPSNVNLNFFKSDNVNNLPFNNIDALRESITPNALTQAELPGGASKKDNNSGDTLLLGYSPLNFTRVARNLYAVPLDTSPHLVSQGEFSTPQTTTTPPGSLQNVIVPPNAFVNGAIGRDSKKAHRDVHMLAAAMAGTNQRSFDISMPFGYIVLDNSKTDKFNGLGVNVNNVFAKELGEGIDVDPGSKYFDNADPPQVKEWQKTKRDPVPDGNGTRPFNPESDGPPYDKIFDNKGEPVQSGQQAADNIAYQPSGPNAIKCTHSNTDSSSPAAQTPCVSLAEPTSGNNPAGMSPFDWAYHKNDGQTYGDSGMRTYENLTASELTCAKVIDTWERATKNTISQPYQANFAFGLTGIRLYPENHNPIQGNSAPWARSNKGFNQHIPPDAESYSALNECQVTTPGTLAQLVDQTMGYTPDRTNAAAPNALSSQSQAIEKIIKQRMHEILPTTAEKINEEYNNTVKKQKLDLGSAYYVYLDPGQGYKHFKVSTERPPWLNKTATLASHAFAPDGTASKVAKAVYGVAMTMSDPNFQWGIHDTPFLRVDGERVVPSPGQESTQGNNGNGKIKAHDEVFVQPNSGAFGNLLNITFQERTSGDGVTFTDRN
jgi:hypothetical protein